MFYEVYTGENYCILALYAHSGNQYHYYEIAENGDMRIVDCLNKVKKNEYYLDYVSNKQLQKIDSLLELFKKPEKEQIKLADNYTADDIPF